MRAEVDAQAAAETAERADPTQSAKATAVNTPTLPASLSDSAPDGSVSFDAQGRVRPSLELRRLFDYFLSAIGERDLAAIRTLLFDHVRNLHGAAVAAEVAHWFDRYVDYQQALAALDSPMDESLRDRFDRVRELRRRLLNADMAEAFFGEEERYTAYTLDRADLMADTTLDETARAARLKDMEGRLSPEQRASRHEAQAALLVDEQNRQFEALQLDPNQRQAEREALFGTEAAVRLAEVDAELAAWDARVRAYVQARDAIRADGRLDAQARERAIANLLTRSFDAAERRRIGSLEAIGQL